LNVRQKIHSLAMSADSPTEKIAPSCRIFSSASLVNRVCDPRAAASFFSDGAASRSAVAAPQTRFLAVLLIYLVALTGASQSGTS